MTASGFDGVERRGLMFVLSSPSGAGKTTLSRMLIERDAWPADVGVGDDAADAAGRGRRHATISSSTSRSSRRWSSGGELLEWATVFDNRYGTPRAPVEAALSAGQDVLFDIDWQGTQQLREKARDDVVSVFILPPSAADLEQAAAHAGAGFRRGHSRPHEAGQPRDQPLGGIRLHRRQPQRRGGVCRSADRSCKRRAAQARAPQPV